MNITENEQVYAIDLVSKYIKNNPPSISKNDMEYWRLIEGKMIRKFTMLEKTFVQIISTDEEKTFLAFSETDYDLRYFRSDIEISHLDNLLS